MAFAYFGAKHGLASKYPAPRHQLIIEPFAGAAGYSVYWANRLRRDVWLNDLDPYVIGLWRRLQDMVTADLDAIEATLGDERTTEILVACVGGSSSWNGVAGGSSRQITPRMRDLWTQTRRRLETVLGHDWKTTTGSYLDLPDIEASWFIDPPYMPIISGAGDFYRQPADAIDFDELAEWVQSRRGQVICCEQSPAAWLPFTPIARQSNGTQVNSSDRTEVVWFNDQQQLSLIDLEDTA